MMELLHLSPVLMALCLLISLNAAVLSERWETKRRIPTVSKKVSGNTFLELIAIWVYILALRKLVYYIPFDGMIQTKTTVWWIEKKRFILFIHFLVSRIDDGFERDDAQVKTTRERRKTSLFL